MNDTKLYISIRLKKSWSQTSPILMDYSSSPLEDTAGCRCRMPSYPLHHNLAVKARNSSFALTASSLWNCLPKHIRDISGLSVEAFKRRLDRVIKLYPDEPRCSASGFYADAHGRASNSLVDISRNREIRQMVATEPNDVQEGGLPGWPSSN